MVPAFLYSLYLPLYKMDISLRQTHTAGPQGVCLRKSWLYLWGSARSHGLNKLLEEHFEFPFNLICKLTMAFLTSQSWPILESWHTGWGGQGFWYCFDDKLNQARVVQMLDSAIHRINHYPADKYYRNNCVIKWIVRVVTKISSCRVNTTSRRGIKRLGISFGSIFPLFSNKSSRGPLY